MNKTETYTPIKPCKRGHYNRYKSSNKCADCARERSGAWAKEHPEARKIIKIRWDKEHPEAKAQWVKDNPDKVKEGKTRNQKKKHYTYKVSGWRRKGVPNPTHAYPADGLCECCKEPETKRHRKTKRLFELSNHHNHKTGEFIGWWCDACNRIEGIAKGSRHKLQSVMNTIALESDEQRLDQSCQIS